MRRDTTRQRNRDAQRPLRRMKRVFDGWSRLWWFRVDLGLPDSMLHTPEASRVARETVARMFAPLPACYVLHGREVGVSGLHVHVLSPLHPLAVSGFQHVQPVQERRGGIAGVARYHAAPCDPRLREADPFKAYTPDSYTRRLNADAALLDYGNARRAALACGRHRLSPKRGWVNLPRPAPLSPRLVLLVAAFLLSLALLAVCESAPSVLPLGAPRRPIPARPVRRVTHPRPPPRTRGGVWSE